MMAPATYIAKIVREENGIAIATIDVTVITAKRAAMTTEAVPIETVTSDQDPAIATGMTGTTAMVAETAVRKGQSSYQIDISAGVNKIHQASEPERQTDV